jgi:hypothetical protein
LSAHSASQQFIVPPDRPFLEQIDRFARDVMPGLG